MFKLYILTFGCQMNEYDSSKIVELFTSSNACVTTNNPEEADLLIINTCSVRHKAQEKLFSKLGQWKLIKKNNPKIKIAVGGCVASQEGKNILKRANYVDIIFGPQTIHRLPEMYAHTISTDKSIIDISFPEIEKFDYLPLNSTNNISCYLTIMEGCSKYCTYCIVPFTRGEEISRPFDDVLKEAHFLASKGAREINLLGQNVNDYHGVISKKTYADLPLLISYIAAIDGIDRIRFTTSHPIAFSDKLIQTFQDIPELVNHLHLPVQSGSDRILKLMNRGYTSSQYENKIAKLRTIRPDIKISTDIIVGFPGETEKDFNSTLTLVDAMGFDNSYTFIYSPRPGTPAAIMDDTVSDNIKKQRLSILQEKIKSNFHTYSNEMIGSIQNILVSGLSKKNSSEVMGRTECNRIVNFNAPAKLIGKFAKVKITQAGPNSLKGSLLI